MLILARYIGEAIFIGQCRVTVLGVVRHKHGRFRVKLGIEAPRQIPIVREELTHQPQERSIGAGFSPKGDISGASVSGEGRKQ